MTYMVACLSCDSKAPCRCCPLKEDYQRCILLQRQSEREGEQDIFYPLGHSPNAQPIAVRVDQADVGSQKLHLGLLQGGWEAAKHWTSCVLFQVHLQEAV